MKNFKEFNSVLTYSYYPYIKIYKKSYIYKKKKITNFHKIILKNAVMIICVKNKKILLTKEFRIGLKKYTWGLPGGFIDKNENQLKSAKRELLEETGLEAKKLHFLYNYTRNANYFCGKDYIFFTDNFKKKRRGEADIKKSWFSKKEVIEKIMKNKIQTPGLIAALLIFFNKRHNFF